MKKQYAVILLLAFGTSLAVANSLEQAPVPEPSPEPEAVAERLPPKLRKFLKKEMHLLAEAGRTMEAALAEGDSKTVEDLAKRMHESFIMKQELTTMDLRELKVIVGEDFVTRDKAFHGMAAELSLAAKAGDVVLQQEIFGNMIRVCAACHVAYAPKASVLE